MAVAAAVAAGNALGTGTGDAMPYRDASLTGNDVLGGSNASLAATASPSK